MNTPYIVGTKEINKIQCEVTVNAEDCKTATDWTRDYFGCSGPHADCRNRNILEYLHSDFDKNHTFRITWK